MLKIRMKERKTGEPALHSPVRDMDHSISTGFLVVKPMAYHDCVAGLNAAAGEVVSMMDRAGFFSEFSLFPIFIPPTLFSFLPLYFISYHSYLPFHLQ